MGGLLQILFVALFTPMFLSLQNFSEMEAETDAGTEEDNALTVPLKN